MKLYILTKDGAPPQWVGTQAEAKALVRELGSGWEWLQYDVPTAKDELLEFLNHCDVIRAATYKMVNAAVEEREAEREFAAVNKPAERYSSPFSAATTIPKIDARLCAAALGQMDGAALAIVTDAVILRLADLKAMVPVNQDIAA